MGDPLFPQHPFAHGSVGMPAARARGLSFLLAIALQAAACGGDALAQSCRPGSTGVSGTLAAPHPCPPPAAKARPEQKKARQPDVFWSGVRIGGSVSTTTTIRGR
jgi:hypothetical protein